LRRGEVLRALVQEVLGAGRYRIELQGTALEAVSRLHFFPGEDVWVRVRSNDDLLVLELLPSKGFDVVV
jgi:hypothetical protein